MTINKVLGTFCTQMMKFKFSLSSTLLLLLLLGSSSLFAERKEPLKDEIKDISSFSIPPINCSDSTIRMAITDIYSVIRAISLPDSEEYNRFYKRGVYQERFANEMEDLMDIHPADDIYLSIWTRERLNPYAMPIDKLPDSILIDCSEFVSPVENAYITSSFGPRRHRYHFGTDLRVKIGDPIRSSFSGKIRIIDYERSGYGHYVVVRHKNGLETVYAHLSKVLVKHDQEVGAGEVIGLGGNTGRSSGPHLHYEIRYLGNAINPAHVVDFANNRIKEEAYLITKEKTFYYNSYLKELQSAKYYTVRKGDTLGAIASRNGTNVNAICRLNKISSKTIIRPGQRLRVR